MPQPEPVEQPTSGDPIRIAVEWGVKLDVNHSQHLITQDFDISPETPASFHIGALDPPPAEALRAFGPNGSDVGALGNLLAYRDLNHNGHLDFTPVDASGFVDELVAVNGAMYLQYRVARTPQFYFNGSAGDLETDAALSLNPAGPQTSCNLLEWLPRFVLDHYHPSTQPEDAWYFEQPRECEDVTPPEGQPLVCYFDRYVTTWTTETSSFVETTCGPVVRICQRTHDPSQPPPPGWPCPCDPTKYQCNTL